MKSLISTLNATWAVYMTIRYLSVCCMNTDAKAAAREVEFMRGKR